MKNAHHTDVCITVDDNGRINKTRAVGTKENVIRLLPFPTSNLFSFCLSPIVISPEKYGKIRLLCLQSIRAQRSDPDPFSDPNARILTYHVTR